MRYTDEELLKLVGEERKRSIGFGEGDSGELRDSRLKALNYLNGDVSADIPTVPNRSSAVSTDVAEAVETALPMILDIFIDGDDVATFPAISAQDEPQAKEESDYVKRVIFSDNEGFLSFYTVCKDALQTKTGIFHWWWETEEEEEALGSVPAEHVAVARMVAQQQGEDLGEGEEQGDGTVAFTRTKRVGKVCIKAVAPEDFTVARDTISLKDTTYCAMRSRPRVQELIANGVDPDVARDLSSYFDPDDSIALARDQAGEETLNRSDGTGDLRAVEVRAHYIRLLDEDGDLKLWRVLTDVEETVLIEKEEQDHVPFGPITPYINAHRFYGESLADKLLEIQRIKTTLLRMFLDSGYFALNQRMEVDMSGANEWTISDLLNNVPNMPVRVAKNSTVTPLPSPGLSFDALAALEHVSVMGEARSGIVRNAQGLNPDTLHDTAKGALALMSEAQRRVRLIARIFAETGVKDLYLGVHALLRQGYGQDDEKGHMIRPHVKMGGEWKDIDPSKWPERKTVDVAVGSAGRDHDLMAMNQVLEVQQGIAMAGVPSIVTPANVYNAAKRLTQAANLKNPELYFSDPAKAPPQPPKPDPEMAKVEMQAKEAQAKLQLQGQSQQADMQMKAQQGQQSAALAEQQAQRDHDLAVMKAQGELQLKRETNAAELQLKRELLEAELQMKRETAIMNAQVARETGMAKVAASSSVSEVEPGGEPG